MYGNNSQLWDNQCMFTGSIITMIGLGADIQATVQKILVMLSGI